MIGVNVRSYVRGFALGIAAVLTASPGCKRSSDSTSIVVEIDNGDLTIGTDIDLVTVQLTGARAKDPIEFPVAAAAAEGKYTFPIRFSVSPASGSDDLVTVEASGSKGNGPARVHTGARANFVKGKVKVLLSLFGRETPVELDFLLVEKL